MFNEFINLFRRYCGLSQQDVADAARISVEKYRSYEYGLADPDEETMRRLAKVFGLKDSVFELGIEHLTKTFEMFEPRYADDNIFKTAEDKAKVKLLVNMLEDDETRLLLLYRTASSKQKNIILQAAMQSVTNTDATVEDAINEHIMSIEGSCNTTAQELAREYNIGFEESVRKLEKVFNSDEWKQLQIDIITTIDKKLKTIIDEEFKN